jgi:HK97 family phage portal protein
MRLFGYEIRRQPRTPPLNAASAAPVSPVRGWYPIVREPYPGAWQRNDELLITDVMAYWAVYACTTLIASDIAKCTLRLVALDAQGIWSETTSAAFSPVLREPNRYQTIQKFIEQWLASKLMHGNAYVLKMRDARGLVVSMYVLDPTRVTPLVAPDGGIYYQLGRDHLSGLTDELIAQTPIVPASEIMHDPMVTLYHPLYGVSPIYACGTAAMHGLTIQTNAQNFFGNNSNPGGMLIAPGAIGEADAQRVKAYWEANYTGANAGRVAVLGDGMQYTQLSVNAVDAQLIEQLKWTEEPICACFHVPVFMIDSTKTPPYANSEPLTQQYYSQCLQTLMVAMERTLEQGLALPAGYGVEFDVDDLIWMDTATRTKAAHDAIAAGVLSPNEARKKYYGLGPVVGGDSPMVQQQYYSLAALAQRDAGDPFATTPAAPAPPAPPDEPSVAAYRAALFQKAATLYGARS